MCEQLDIWNPIACASEFVKDCEIDEYLKHCEYMMSLDDDCNE